MSVTRVSNAHPSPSQQLQHSSTPPPHTPQQTPLLAPIQDGPPPSNPPHQIVSDPPSPPAFHITPSIKPLPPPSLVQYNHYQLIPSYSSYFYHPHYNQQYQVYLLILSNPHQRIPHQFPHETRSAQPHTSPPSSPSFVSHSVCFQSSPYPQPRRFRSCTRSARSCDTPSPSTRCSHRCRDSNSAPEL